jgi:hypothetical protein
VSSRHVRIRTEQSPQKEVSQCQQAGLPYLRSTALDWNCQFLYSVSNLMERVEPEQGQIIALFINRKLYMYLPRIVVNNCKRSCCCDFFHKYDRKGPNKEYLLVSHTLLYHAVTISHMQNGGLSYHIFKKRMFGLFFRLHLPSQL